MKLQALEFHNNAREWTLERTTFPELTLLVGISGVGKTQILDSIMTLKRVARGKNVQGIRWIVEFSANGEAAYRWEGEFEEDPAAAGAELLRFQEGEDRSKPQAPVRFERLYRNGELIVDRIGEEILLRGTRTPKLSPFESALSMLNREEEIAPAYGGFGKIIHSDQVGSSRAMYSFQMMPFEKLLERYDSLERIQESELDTFFKLALAYHHAPAVFNQIQQRFISVFPQVECVRLETLEQPELPFLAKYPVLQMREDGVTKWIQQREISSGMFRTIMQLADMFLSPDGTVVLIDEFENSLGINCIDVVTEDLLYHNRRLQFIVTSHHPYIINNISPEHWKIVRRAGGVVSTRSATELKLHKSSHEAFLQLINLEEYKNGILAA